MFHTSPSNTSWKPAPLLIAFVLGILVFSAVPKTAFACTGWEQVSCQYLKQQLEEIAETVHGVLLAAYKNAVIQIVTQNVYVQIGGQRGGGPMFITDWRVALYVQPSQKAQFALNDFFTLSTGGRGAFANYQPQAGTQINPRYLQPSAGTTAEGILNNDIVDVRYGNYNKFLVDTAKRNIFAGTCSVNIQEFGKVGSSFRSLDALTTDDGTNCNNIFNYTDAANTVYRNTLQQESNIAQTQGIAYQGYIGLTQNGIIVTPGSNLKALVDNVSDIPNKVMSAIENPYEFAAAAVSTAINASVNVLTQQGLAYVNTMTQRGVGYANSGISSGTNGIVSVGVGNSGYSYNPAASYVNQNNIPKSQIFNIQPTTNRQ